MWLGTGERPRFHDTDGRRRHSRAGRQTANVDRRRRTLAEEQRRRSARAVHQILSTGQSSTDRNSCCSAPITTDIYKVLSHCQGIIHRQAIFVGKSKAKYTDIAVRSLTCHTATETHMPYRITQCYLPPDRGDISAFTPAEAGTRLSDPGGMQG